MKNKIVIVEWVDSVQPTSEWSFVYDLPKPKPITCFSVGWLIKSNKDATMLASNVGNKNEESAQVSGVIKIPARSIIRIKKLKG